MPNIYFLGNIQDLTRLGFKRTPGIDIRAWRKTIYRGPDKFDRYIHINETRSGFELVSPSNMDDEILSFLREEDLLEEFK